MRETLPELESRYKNERKKLRQRLEVLIERCYEVKDDLSVDELELIWFIRKSSHCHLLNYYMTAKRFFEAESAYKELVGLVKSEVDK